MALSTRLEEQTRADIVEAGRRMYARGYVARNDGNISARLDDSRMITTPKSVSKGFMTPDMMVIVDYEGKKLSGDRDPSSELPMHLEIYRNRPDVNAVVHAHPPIATGFAVAGIPLTRAVLAEVDHDAGQHSDRRIRHAVHRGTAGGGAQVHQGARRSAAGEPRRRDLLPDGDDARTTRWKPSSTSPRSAWWRGCSVGENLISREEVERLQGLRGMYGIAAPAPLCADPAELAATDQVLCQVLEAPESRPSGSCRRRSRRCARQAETGKFG